jgi:hypothetical protein
MKTKPGHFKNPMDQACIYRHTGSRPTQGMASLRVSLAFIFFHHKNNLLNEFSGDTLVKNNLWTIHILLQHIFGLFLTHPPTSALIALKISKKWMVP